MSLGDVVSRRSRAASRASVLLGMLPVLLLGLLVLPGGARAADPAPVTYQGPIYPSAAGAPSADKPQSKLWFNDGAWWGLLRTTGGITIHRLVNHSWQSTGTVVDERLASTGDALWDGSRLFVASRVSSGALRVIRLSYNTTTDTYAVELTREVASSGTESITIAKDSQSRLWVSYTRGSRVYVAHSTTDHATWTAPFVIPVADNTVTSDDISAVVAFNGKIGVMYSDQGNATMWFAVHEDTAPDSSWTLETALSGTAAADDHINLKSLLQDDEGRIYAATKTSRTDAEGPSIMVLQRSSSGTWAGAASAKVKDGLTRAQLALDSTGRRLYVLMADEGGGSTVYYKTTPLGALSFGAGRGSAFVTWSGAQMNDPSTTKQGVSAATGLVVLASDDKSTTKRYYHAELSLDGTTAPAPADTTPPTTPTGVTATPTSASSASVSWSASTDNMGVTGYRVYRDTVQVGTASGTSFAESGLAASTTYSYTVAAIDAAGNLSSRSAAATATTPSGPSPSPGGPTSFVAASTASGATSSTTVASPAGVAAGDVLLAAVSSRGAPTISAPAGWTLVRVDTNGTVMRQAVFVRVATGTGEASTWTLSSAKDHVVQVIAYRGADTSSPVVASSGALSTTASITSPSVTSTAGAQVVTFAGIARTSPLAPGSPLVERSEVSNASTASYKISANSADTSSSSGPFTTTANGSSAGMGHTVALRPRT